MTTTGVHILGIRHHGPGSARSVREALGAIRPDAILVEGPPDAAGEMPRLIDKAMKPPVALLLYRPDMPHESVYYPFAAFSPEWQALHYGLTNKLPVRFMDLPIANVLAMRQPEEPEEPADEPEATSEPAEPPESVPIESLLLRQDPLRMLAEASGYSDGERWWEHMVEQRRDCAGLFAAIMEAMSALRSEVGDTLHLTEDDRVEEVRREAHMRQTIRAAQKEGFERIAVVCGAWHAPALAEMPSAKEDSALLQGLPKVKVEATWVPWTYGRLAYRSGYGAGIESPGWYHYLWSNRGDVAVGWMSRVARLLRDEGLDASPASVIEAVRLADTLAALRGRPLPGLPELNEATVTVFCFGNDAPLRLISERLIIGDRLGRVPADTPMVPLQQDLQREQRRLRLPPDAAQKMLDLDLRNATDLGRSLLLHRLNLLGVTWGVAQDVYGKHGTFHELWQLQWKPEFAVNVIEAAVWGNTVPGAAAAQARDAADKAATLPDLTGLLQRVMLADLPDVVRHVMDRLQSEAAVSSDVAQLMEALPPLARAFRYTDVRQTDKSMIGHALDGLIARICIGLPAACGSLDDDAAQAMFERITETDGTIRLLQNAEYLTAWRQTERALADQANLHGLVAGRCCRLLLDAGDLEPGDGQRRLGLALSAAVDPAQAGAWAEGFLKGNGLLLLHDEDLWQAIDEWVTGLTDDHFMAVVPLLRRTFATFDPPVRKQMGERVKRGFPRPVTAVGAGAGDGELDVERAEAVLPLVARLLGLDVAVASVPAAKEVEA